MAQDIKQKIVLDGEKEYNAALKSAQRNLRTLKSELKAETAELGNNATAAQKNEVKIKSLRKQISEQEKVVKTYEKALKEVREKYAGNEEAIAKWEQKLNNARATLGNMRNELDNVGDSFRHVEADAAATVTATKSVADALGDIASVGETISGAIEGAFTGMLDTLRNVASEVWDMISETAARANNWTDIAGYWDTDAQTIQKWAHAVAASQNEFTDLQSAVSKIVLGDHEKIADLTGVSLVGDMDDWEYAMKVMDAMAGMSTSQRNNALAEIFGEKRATKTMDLLNDWGEIRGLLDQFDGNTGDYGMSDKELETMNAVWVEIGKIEEKWQTLQQTIAGGLGEASLDLMINVEGAMDGIAAFLNSDNPSDKDAALEQVRKNVEEFFTKVGELIRESIGILDGVAEDLQQSNDPLTKAIGDVLDAVADGLQWMVDNQDKVVGALKAIFGVWLTSQLASVAAQLADIVLQIQTIQAFKGLGAAASAGGAAATGAAAGAGGSWLSKTLGNIFGSDAFKFLGGFGAFFGTWFENAFKPQGNDDILSEEEMKAYEKDHALEIAAQRTTFAANEIKAALADAMKEWLTPEPGIVEYESLDDQPMVELTAAQRNAAEAYWDILRNPDRNAGDVWDSFSQLAALFEGSDFGAETFSQLESLLDSLQTGGYNEADLPSWWFDGPDSGETLTHDDVSGFRGLPAQIAKAAQAGTAAGVNGIRVTMDGATVGRLVAPTVSNYIASLT